MKQIRNIQIPGRHGKDILADLFFEENGTKKEVVLFWKTGGITTLPGF